MLRGGDFVIRPTRTQSGGFLGTLLASIGIPLLVKAITGSGQQGGYMIPNNKLRQFLRYGDSLTPEQRRKLMDAIRIGSDFFLKLTRSQQGSGLFDSILRLIGIGKGLQNRPHYQGSSIYTDLVRSMAGSGKKKTRRGKGLILGPNSPFKNIPLLGDVF